MQSEDVIRLAGQLELIHDKDLDALYPRNFCGWVEVQCLDGEWKRYTVLNPSGSAANASRGEAIEAKTATLLTPLLGSNGAARLRESFKTLAETPIRELLANATVHDMAEPAPPARHCA